MCRSRFGFAITDKGPILAPTTQALIRAGHHVPVLIYGVIVSFRKDPQSDCVIESVHLYFDRLHCSDLAFVERVAQTLPLIRVNPIAMHLENIVGFVRPRAFPIKQGPGCLQLVEDQTGPGLEVSKGPFASRCKVLMLRTYH